jgi:Uma2 family endonuclease
MVANLKSSYTLEEYFELERNSEERYEFWDGEIFCMSGGSAPHERITRDTLVHLTARLAGRGCEAFTSNMRIKVPSMPPYRYPDVSALCGEAEFEKIGGVDTLLNPSLIIEVLSPSTEAYDRGEKFRHYKSIPSFCEYVLIAQDHAHVTQISRRADGEWIYRDFTEMDASVALSSMNCELKLGTIYRNVTFPPPVAPPLVNHRGEAE